MQQRIGNAAFLAFILAIPSICAAQTDTSADQWQVVTTFHIKPGYRTEFEATQKEVTAAYKKAGAPYRVVIQTLFGDLTEYTAAAPIANFAELDGSTTLVKALGNTASGRLLKRCGAYLSSVQRVAMLALNDISFETPVDPGDYVHIMTFHLRLGKGADFAAFMKSDYLPALRKGGVSNAWMNEPVFGGNPNERVLIMRMHKLAELDDGPPVRRALGGDGARALGLKQAEIVESVSHLLGQIRTDLSLIPPAPPKSTN